MRVVTWNIAAGRTIRSAKQFDYQEGPNLPYFLSYLATLDPDILCLQESHGNEHYSMAREIAQALRMPYVHEKRASPSHIDRDYMLCNAILSKKPFTDPQEVFLPHPPFQLYLGGKPVPPFDRYLISVEFPGFRAATMHVEPLSILGHSYGKGDGLQFGHMIDEVLVKTLRVPFIFTADLYEEHPEIPFPKFMKKFAMQDALPAGQFTTPVDDGPDHIMCTPEWRVLDSKIIKTQTDHYLCVADIEKIA